MEYYQEIIEGNPELKKNKKFLEKNNENIDYNEVLTQVDEFLNDNIQDIDIKSMKQAKMCFYAMKDIYNNRMREYVSELNYISNKLEKYDEILSKKLIKDYNFSLFYIGNKKKQRFQIAKALQIQVGSVRKKNPM